MVAVNLLASLLTTNNLCTSICLKIIACITMANFELYCMSLIWWYSVAYLICEALSGGGGGGYMFPCSSEINWLVPLFPELWFSYIPCSLILSLFPSKFGISSSVPLK